MPDDPKDVVDMQELLKERLGPITEDISTGFSELRSQVATMGDEAKKRAEELSTKQAEHDAVLAELVEMKKSLETNRLSLPGSEDVPLTLGDFARAAAVAVKEGKPEADRRFPAVAEIHGQVMKHTPDNLTMRLLSTEIDSAAGYLVPEQMAAGYIEKLYANTAIEAVGARRIGGLTGYPYKALKMTGSATAYWVGEGDAITGSDTAFGRVSWYPKKLGCLSGLTDEQLMWSGENIGQIIEDDFARQMGLKADLAFMEGTGGEYQPLGLANVSGIVAYNALGAEPAAAANGRDLRAYQMRRMRQKLEEANVPMSSFGYIMHTKLKNILSNEVIRSGGSGTAPENIGDALLHGAGVMTDEQLRSLYGPIGHSTQFSSTETAGSNSDAANVYAGNWSSFWIPQWGGIAVGRSNQAYVGSRDSFSEGLTWIKATMLVDSGPSRAGDFLKGAGFRTTISYV